MLPCSVKRSPLLTSLSSSIKLIIEFKGIYKAINIRGILLKNKSRKNFLSLVIAVFCCSL